jgi:hypothetical protein
MYDRVNNVFKEIMKKSEGKGSWRCYIIALFCMCVFSLVSIAVYAYYIYKIIIPPTISVEILLISDIPIVISAVLVIISEKRNDTHSVARIACIAEIRAALVAIGLDSEEKIIHLQTEIKDSMDKRSLTRKSIISVLAKMLSYVFVGFIGAIFGTIFAPRIETYFKEITALDDVLQFIGLSMLVLITILITLIYPIAISICIVLILSKIFRIKKLRILFYLNEIRFYIKTTSDKKLPEINMGYLIPNIEKTLLIKDTLAQRRLLRKLKEKASHFKNFLKQRFSELFKSKNEATPFRSRSGRLGRPKTRLRPHLITSYTTTPPRPYTSRYALRWRDIGGGRWLRPWQTIFVRAERRPSFHT